MPAAALRKDSASKHQASATVRGEVLARYRYLREMSKLHHSKAMEFLTKAAILNQARRLGLGDGKSLILNSMDELTLVYDLTIHTAPPGRTRAIDRCARSAQFASGSEEALLLGAMCNARFAVVEVQRKHHAAGLIVTDLFRNIELWLVDQGLETSMPEGALYATRYFTPDRFAMTAGVGMPVDLGVLEEALESVPPLLRKSRTDMVEDRRFAEAIYRIAIADGIMENIAYLDPPGTDTAA
jgi:hypothetical protein